LLVKPFFFFKKKKKLPLKLSKINSIMYFATQSKKSAIVFALLIVVILVGQVSAHGRMIKPEIRIRPGDENQGFTITNGPTNEQPCAGNAPGPVKSRFRSGETINVQWKITAAHRGSCTVQLSTTGSDTDFKDLKKLDKCADENGDFNEDVKLPDVNCEKCTLRFQWNAELTNELYLNCADISIGNGNNKREAKGIPSSRSVKRRLGRGRIDIFNKKA